MTSVTSVELLTAAVQASWTKATSADPSRWSEDNPSRGQCDVTSLVVVEYLGGDLQLAQVFLDGEQVEYHYWNQLTDGDVLDLTREQFTEGQRIGDPELMPHDLIRSKYPEAREDLRHRHAALRDAVSDLVGAAPEHPLGTPPEPFGNTEIAGPVVRCT